jgi:RNA polymerase sigma-70 factor (ECF subfamily)
MQHNRSPQFSAPLDDELEDIESEDLDPEELLQQSQDTEIVRRALQELPVEYREVLVLRELEEMSYKEIAGIADLPVGTVMSRLARGRKRLQKALTKHRQTEVLSELPKSTGTNTRLH